jgi:hypothetical protein
LFYFLTIQLLQMKQLYCHFSCLLNIRRVPFLLLPVIIVSISFSAISQTKLTATASSGSAYSVITAAGFAHENPDCVHGSFGAHVTQAFDADLNKNVFVFHSHIADDNDRCTNFDRVRMEIKGNNSTTQHTEGQTAYYRWKFKLDANFIGGSSFCHIFQIKAYTGDAGAPIITITPRTSVLEIIHDGGDESGAVDLGKLITVPLAPFKGAWVEGYVKYKSSNNGSIEITLKRVSDGATLLSYSKTSGIDLWRTGGGHNRPKWGVYRSKNSTSLRNEQVRFADFCVSESSASQCPGTARLMTNTSVTEVQNTMHKAALRFQNPATGNTIIHYNLPEGGLTNLTIFDQSGRVVKVLVNSYLNKGSHQVKLSEQAIAAGVYFITLVQKDNQITRQLIKR